MRRVYSWINGFVCLFVLAVIVMTFNNSMADGNKYLTDYDLDSGWKYENGETADLLDIKRNSGTVTITRPLTSNESSGAALCFQTSNLFFDITLDDETIFSFHPTLSRIEGKYYGDHIHFVNIPSFEGIKDLSITYEPLIDNNYTSFRSMKLQSPREYEYDILKANLPKFLVSVIVVIFGMFLALFGIIFDKDVVHRAETTSLGAFAIIMGVWTNAGSMVIQSLTDNSSFARILDYTALMLLPIPVMIFMAAFTNSLSSKLYKSALWITILNFLFIYTTVLLGIFDYHDLLFTIHIMLVVGVSVSVILLIRGIRRRGRQIKKDLVAAFVILFVAGTVDLIRYYFLHSLDVAKYSRLGIALFILIFAVYELRQLFDLTRKGMELEVMEKIAHTDGLTGLLNRNALEELETEIKQRDSGRYIFVQLDINGLKAINDTYGHSAGDVHIMAAADILVESFGSDAKCFRMGGDEFLVVLEGDDCDERYTVGIKNFTDLEAEYNKTVDEDRKLITAFGYAEYECTTHDPEKAERVADMRMYECKARLKAEAT
ncbi:MAG: GGDEF domain-containing protein [Ruminococcus sp.]|nr:GGDEF domain-containing protein [Ruminococcus sp.]